MALDAGRVWFTATLDLSGSVPEADGGGVMSVAMTGGDAEQIVTSEAPCWRSIAIAADDSRVFFSESSCGLPATGRIRSVAQDGSGLTTLAPDEPHPYALVLDAAHVFWGTDVDPEYVSGVRSVPRTGGTIVTVGTAAAVNQSVVADLTIDDANVYWTSGGYGGAVMSAPKAGGPEMVLATRLQDPRGIAVNGEHVYWVASGIDLGSGIEGGALMRVPLGGGTPEVLAAGQDGAEAIALDDTHVYWTLRPDAIRRMPLAGGDVVDVLAGTGEQALSFDGVLVDIALDGTHVYFASDYGVWRIEKP
jgi:hypothetical protein